MHKENWKMLKQSSHLELASARTFPTSMLKPELTCRQLFQALAELHLQHAPFAKRIKEVQLCSKAPRA